MKFRKSILKWLAPKIYESILTDGEIIGVWKERQSAIETRQNDRIQAFEYTHSIGNFIIAVPNEYDDIIFGQIIRHEMFNNSPVAFVYDYLRGEELLLNQKAYPYTEHFAETISNLNPNDRHILIYHSKKNFTDINKDTIVGWDETKSILEKNGFFEAINRKNNVLITK